MRRLSSLLIAIAIAVGLWTAAIYTQGVQCGGSFVPSMNCTIGGRWYFTSRTSSVGTTSQGPIPFQVRDQNGSPQDVTGITSVVRDLTNAEVLAINATPITVVPAPGAGYYVDVLAVDGIFNYTTAYSSGSNMKLFYGSRTGGNAASASMTVSGWIVSVSADTIIHVAGIPDNTNPPTTNVGVVIQGTTPVAFSGGNAANSVRIVVWYRIVKTGL